MERKSIRQMSILGVVLMVASAVTAAVVPDKPADNQTNSLNDGKLLINSGAGGSLGSPVVSCVAGASPFACHITSSGTGAATVVITAQGGEYTTQNNTSLSRTGVAGDTTSILIPA